MVVKEVAEETGIECEVVKPISILDGMRLGFTGIPLYSLVFHCRMTGGTLKPIFSIYPKRNQTGLSWKVLADRPREPVWLHENDDENLSEVFPDF